MLAAGLNHWGWMGLGLGWGWGWMRVWGWAQPCQHGMQLGKAGLYLQPCEVPQSTHTQSHTYIHTQGWGVDCKAPLLDQTTAPTACGALAPAPCTVTPSDEPLNNMQSLPYMPVQLNKTVEAKGEVTTYLIQNYGLPGFACCCLGMRRQLATTHARTLAGRTPPPHTHTHYLQSVTPLHTGSPQKAVSAFFQLDDTAAIIFTQADLTFSSANATERTITFDFKVNRLGLVYYRVVENVNEVGAQAVCVTVNCACVCLLVHMSCASIIELVCTVCLSCSLFHSLHDL